MPGRRWGRIRVSFRAPYLASVKSHIRVYKSAATRREIIMHFQRDSKKKKKRKNGTTAASTPAGLLAEEDFLVY